VEADAAVGKYVPKYHPFAGKPPSWLPAMLLLGTLAIYVSIPALIAALLFRGGLVLLIAGVTYVRKDGRRASRLRLLWRAIVVWSPVCVAFVLSVVAIIGKLNWGPWLALALPGLMAVLSVALPTRGLQDRLAGTWPVPR
jgi:eukaryotic-like serine/threonine-protein kinase